MSDRAETANPSVTGETRRFLAELAEMVDLRKQLAEEEIRSDLATARRLATGGGIGAVLVLTGLPVLVMFATGRVDAWIQSQQDQPGGWPWVTLGAALVLLVGGVVALSSSWRRFRRDFLGLQESLAEIKEDLAWLREMLED